MIKTSICFILFLSKEALSGTLRIRQSSCIFSIGGFCPIESIFGTLILFFVFSVVPFLFKKIFLSSNLSPKEIQRRNDFSVLTDKIKRLPEMPDEQIVLTLKECYDYFVKYPQDYAAMMAFSKIEKALGQYNNAIFYLKSAEQIIPADLIKYCYYCLSECYEETGKIGTALYYIDKARKECAGNYDDFAAKVNEAYKRLLDLENNKPD